MSNLIESPIKNWIPYKIIANKDELLFEWIYLGNKIYEEPFFDETIIKCKSNPINSKGFKVITNIDLLLKCANNIESIPLTGLIFHVSRCGSTMISQSLALKHENIIIPEAEIIDQIIRNESLSLDKKKELLFAVLKLLGQKRNTNQQHFIIKLDSWHLLKIDFIRELFPHLPFIILSRNPEQVLKSHIFQPGMHMVPHVLPIDIFDISADEIQDISFNEYRIKVLTKYYQAINSFTLVDKQTTLLDYKLGMRNVFNIVIDKFNIALNEIDNENVNNRLNFHSKNPQGVFSKDKEIDTTIHLGNLFDYYNLLSNYSIT